jgi:hypothetical protein
MIMRIGLFLGSQRGREGPGKWSRVTPARLAAAVWRFVRAPGLGWAGSPQERERARAPPA